MVRSQGATLQRMTITSCSVAITSLVLVDQPNELLD